MRSTIRTRLLAAFLAIAVLSAAGLSFYFLTELEGFALRKLEERLDTQARLVAAFRGAAYAEKDLSAAAGPRAGRRRAARRSVRRSPRACACSTATGAVVADSADRDRGARAAQPRRRGRRSRAALRGSARRDDAHLGRAAASRCTSPYPIVARDGRASSASRTPRRRRSRSARCCATTATRLAWVIVAFVARDARPHRAARALARPAAARARERRRRASRAATTRVRVTPGGSRETRAVADVVQRAGRRGRERDDGAARRGAAQVALRLGRQPRAAHAAHRHPRRGRDAARRRRRRPRTRNRFLSTIVRESDRLTRLANDLLILQRIEGATGELPLRRIDLGAVVRRAVEALEPLMEERGVSRRRRGRGARGARRRRPHPAGRRRTSSTTRAASRPRALGIRVHDRPRRALGDDRRRATPVPASPRRTSRTSSSASTAASRRATAAPAASGLGLSIVKAIVVAHGGDIDARQFGRGGRGVHGAPARARAAAGRRRQPSRSTVPHRPAFPPRSRPSTRAPGYSVSGTRARASARAARRHEGGSR